MSGNTIYGDYLGHALYLGEPKPSDYDADHKVIEVIADVGDQDVTVVLHREALVSLRKALQKIEREWEVTP